MDSSDSEQPVTWRQVSGTRVELSDDRAINPSFEAPKLLVAEELVFEVSTIRNGELVTETVGVVVDPVITVKRPMGYALTDWEPERDSRATEFDSDEEDKRGLPASILAMMVSVFRKKV